MVVPVTNRGDAIGLLELLLLAAPGEDVLDAVRGAAHVLAYVVIANGRFTDLCIWGKRSRPPRTSGHARPAPAGSWSKAAQSQGPPNRHARPTASATSSPTWRAT